MRAPMAPTGLVDPSGRSISRFDVARARSHANAGGAMGASFEAGSTGGAYFSEWPAALRSADREWLPSRVPATARIRERVRNDPVARAGAERRKNSAVGRGWKVKFRPNARALGISLEAARELGAKLTTEFELYSYGHAFTSDATRRGTFGQQLRQAVSHLVIDGEALGLAEWAPDESTRYATRLRLVDPARLCNPNGRTNSDTLRDGIELNAAEVPIRYHIRERMAGDFAGIGQFRWKAFDRWTEWGRPQVFHCFEADQAGQSRGISRFVSVLKSFRALSKFTDATIESATINALIVAFMKSNGGPQAVSENFESPQMKAHEEWRQNYYENNPVNLASGARIPVLPYGDELELQTASRDVGSFDAFVRSIIRLIAAALGVTYEELSMDYSQTNYSSARAAMIHAWAETVSLMGLAEDQLVRPFCVAWAEEAFDRGYVQVPAGAPDFYDAVDAYVQIRCIGPGKGVIDGVKEIDAMAGRIELGVSTLEDECEELGRDPDEVMEQRARERDRLEELGLPLPGGALAGIAQTARDPAHSASLDQRATA